MKSTKFFHFLAIATAIIWGTTFVSSRLLLDAGLSPASIMMLRFAIAYLCLWPFYRGRIMTDNWRDELGMAILGITGGSMYFLLENTALLYTQASNVAIIIAATPLLTTITVHLFSRQERANSRLYAYSALSLLGVILVVFNGEFILKLNPLGDILTLGASIMWVLYSIIILRFNEKYEPLFITRKIFFYGMLTLLPYFFFEPWGVTWQILTQPTVIFNLLFLGIVASLLCYWSWNVVIDKLGAIRSTNYLYLNPIVAMITSYFVLDERITLLAIIGTGLILTGMYLAQRKQ